MLLAEPEKIKQVLLETPLELETEDALERVERRRDSQTAQVTLQEVIRTMPLVSIGLPESWPLQELYPLRKMPRPLRSKVAKADYHLVRLCCSFRPIHQKSRVQWARFRVSLLPDHIGQYPIANDLYPVEVLQEVKRQTRISLAPTLKFQEIQVSAGEVDFGLEYRELQPRISAAGAGQADPSWDYAEAQGMGLQGSKWMYLLVKAPKGMVIGRATLDLVADIEVEGLHLPVVVLRNHKQAEAQLTVQLWDSKSQ